MPTLLIGWELGAGGGHIHRLIPIIDRYLDRGWKIVAALRLRHAALAHFSNLFSTSLADGRFTIIQAPIFLHRSPSAINASSLAEIFAHIGFAEPDLLAPVVAAWERVIATYQPDAILSDMAPSLNLAASDRAPVIVIGNGWTIPPDTQKPASFKQGIDTLPPADEASNLVVEVASRVTAGRFSSERFSDLLRGQNNLVCTLKAFDPYADKRKDSYFWPIEIPSEASSPKSRERGFIYLPGDHPMLSAMLDVLAAGKRQFDGYFGGQRLSAPNLVLAAEPLDLSQILPSAAVAIHHGGLGTAIGCWVNRVPQFICAPDTEKQITGVGLAKAGAGILAPRSANRELLFQSLASAAKLNVPGPDCADMATASPADTLEALSLLTG